MKKKKPAKVKKGTRLDFGCGNAHCDCTDYNSDTFWVEPNGDIICRNCGQRYSIDLIHYVRSPNGQ
jgi:hypothetical protein